MIPPVHTYFIVEFDGVVAVPCVVDPDAVPGAVVIGAVVVPGVIVAVPGVVVLPGILVLVPGIVVLVPGSFVVVVQAARQTANATAVITAKNFFIKFFLLIF